MNRPSFGMVIRGLRMGYGYSDSMEGFMRLSDEGENFYVELVPYNRPELFTKTDKYHRVWWDEHEEGLEKHSPVLSRIRNIKKQINFILNERGELV